MESTSRGQRLTTYSSTALFFDSSAVGEWVRERVSHVDEWGPFTAIGLERDGELIAGTVYNHYTGANVMMSFAAIPGRRWLTRSYLRAMFRYPFAQLGVRRVTGFVASKNADSLRFSRHLGAREEGVMRQALPDDDLVIFGMLREECRWL